MLIYLHFCVSSNCWIWALLRWNTPQYPRICPFTTTHFTHSAHENSLHHKSPLRCLPGPDQTKGPLRERDVPPPRRRSRSSPDQAETRVDQGLAPNKSSLSRLQTFGDLIDLHITDMCEVGTPPRREPRPPRSRRSSAISGVLGSSKEERRSSRSRQSREAAKNGPALPKTPLARRRSST
jgi:hypothetical protein